jgi:hypothetical protein
MDRLISNAGSQSLVTSAATILEAVVKSVEPGGGGGFGLLMLNPKSTGKKTE